MDTLGRRDTVMRVDAQAHQSAYVLGPEKMARRQQELAGLDVVADLEHVLTGSDGTHHLDSRVINHLGVFDHHHGVRAVREHPAGVHLGDVASA